MLLTTAPENNEIELFADRRPVNSLLRAVVSLVFKQGILFLCYTQGTSHEVHHA